MNIEIVYKELLHSGNCRILQSSFSNSNIPLRKIAEKKPGRKNSYTDALYLLDDSTWNLPDSTPQNFILFHNGDDFLSLEDYKDHNFIVLAPTRSREEVCDFLNTLFDDDMRLNVSIQPLIEGLLKDNGLQELSDITSQILGNPFWVIDMNYNYLTKPYGEISDPNILSEMQSGYINDETIMELKKSKTRDTIARLNEAYGYKVYNSDHQMIMAAVKIKNTTVAYINVYNENHAFSTYDYRVMNKAADIFSTELQKNSYFRNNRSIMFSSLMIDLLDNRFIQHSDVNKRLSLLGYTTEKFYHFLTIDLKMVQSRDIQLNSLSEQIHYIFPNCIYSIYENHFVFVISSKEMLTESTAAIKKLEHFLSSGNLTAAISPAFYDLNQTHKNYQKTLAALQLANTYYTDASLVFYSSLAFTHALDCCIETVSYQDLCQGALSRLLLADTDAKNDYLLSVYTWIMHNMQIPAAAKELHIHENTLRYRLDKAKKIMDYPLKDGQQIAEFLFAYKLYCLTNATVF